jgi:hypothetical protein
MSDCCGINDNYDNWKNLIERSYPEGITIKFLGKKNVNFKKKKKWFFIF